MTNPSFNNCLLRSLNASSAAEIRKSLTLVPLKLRAVIEELGKPVTHVYFPERGVISIVVQAGSKSTEVGLIGMDGMTGTSLLLGDRISPNLCMVQLAGEAYRMGANDFVDFIEKHDEFRDYLLKYVQAFMIQCNQTALAMRAPLEQRLARWLLMVHDRAGTSRLELTHDFMALMLATRRAGVTVTLHELEGKALIRSERGAVVIVDPEGLKELADPYYGPSESEYSRIMDAGEQAVQLSRLWATGPVKA